MKKLQLTVMCAAALIVGSSAEATFFRWTDNSGADSNWDNGGNWDQAGATPGAADIPYWNDNTYLNATNFTALIDGTMAPISVDKIRGTEFVSPASGLGGDFTFIKQTGSTLDVTSQWDVGWVNTSGFAEVFRMEGGTANIQKINDGANGDYIFDVAGGIFNVNSQFVDSNAANQGTFNVGSGEINFNAGIETKGNVDMNASGTGKLTLGNGSTTTIGNFGLHASGDAIIDVPDTNFETGTSASSTVSMSIADNADVDFAGLFTLADQGTGVLDMTGGTLDVDTFRLAWNGGGSSATVNLSGGIITVHSILGTAPNGSYVFNISDEGVLRVDISGSFDAGVAQNLIDSGVFSGTDLNTVDAPDGFTYIVSGFPPLPGDLNGDNFVGIDDLNIVLANWNQNVPPGDPAADPSGDGFVGIDDLNEVLGNWNAGLPPAVGASSQVPEPGSAVLLLGTVAISVLRRA